MTTYLYNGWGQYVGQRSGGEAANPAGIYVYDEAGNLLGEYDTATGKPAREIIYHQGIPVAVLSYRATGTAPNQVWSTEVGYIFTDHLNTPRVIVRASDNKVVWRWDDADPFGVAPPNENPSGLGTFTFNMRMPGQYYDRATNLFYNYFRDYEPQTGRYIQSDPIGLAGGINTYAYASGNPLGYTDPDGLSPVGVAIGVGVRVIGGRAAVGAIGAAARRYGPVARIAACALAGVCILQDKTPNEGEPGSCHVNPGSGQERQYGNDGLPDYDIDWDHDHGQGVPHGHNWGRNPDGSPKRGPGVPVSPWPQGRRPGG
ncbi:RHS repeat-associated core domain-containing protein [Massilia sp. YMA4]|uniref:RHS repeat-associated core domain-containing protein n=1 Tax=Massilia sp. YMA4 TaxID=1593482 RepID=UPI000DD0F136|nr:RHS repeat-associated core domain-containing protein [Massilia sp. YMA4]AXA93105.1 hypothetical protein DPH57_19350 [Massilia sp. YMA4]